MGNTEKSRDTRYRFAAADLAAVPAALGVWSIWALLRGGYADTDCGNSAIKEGD